MRSGWLLQDSSVVCALAITDGPSERGVLRGRDGCEGAVHVGDVRCVLTARMRFPLDVAFLSRDLEVVRVARVKPWRFAWGGRSVRSMVQAEAGALERWGIRPGDQLEVREAAIGADSDAP